MRPGFAPACLAVLLAATLAALLQPLPDPSLEGVSEGPVRASLRHEAAPAATLPAPPPELRTAGPPAPARGEAWRLRGRVLDARGGPLAGARIRAERLEGGRRLLEAEGQSGKDGSFDLALPGFAGREGVWLLDTRLEVRIEAPGHAPHRGFLPASSFAGRQAWLEVLLDRAGGIRGRVLDRQGRPVEDVRVHLHGGPGATAPETRTDAVGRFLLPVPADGRYFLRAWKEGAGATLLGPVELLRDGPVTEAGDLVLQGEHEIRGTAVLRDGTPAAGVVIVARAEGSLGLALERWAEGLPRASARTDAGGRFRLGGLGPGVHLVEAQQPGLPGRQVLTEAGGEPLRLVLDGHLLRVRVTGPAAGEARLLAALPGEDPRSGCAAVTPRVAPGPAGTADLWLPRTGRWVVSAAAPGFAPREAAVEIGREKRLHLLDLRLEPAGPPARLVLERDPGGRPLGAYRWWLRSPRTGAPVPWLPAGGVAGRGRLEIEAPPGLWLLDLEPREAGGFEPLRGHPVELAAGRTAPEPPAAE